MEIRGVAYHVVRVRYTNYLNFARVVARLLHCWYCGFHGGRCGTVSKQLVRSASRWCFGEQSRRHDRDAAELGQVAAHGGRDMLRGGPGGRVHLKTSLNEEE